jgi:hypothetical protein
MSTKYIINNSDLILPSQEINADLNIVGGLSSTTISATTLYVSGNNVTRPYKVYTALLTQSGGDNFQSISSGSLTIGVTYQIISASGDPGDFTNVGAPNNNLGTYFVATGTDPNEWGAYELEYNEGAPVVTVLENTIGNIWFTYFGIGQYQIFSDNLFTLDKSWATAYSGGDDEVSFNGFVVSPASNNEFRLNSGNSNDNHVSIRLEIRVYN